VNTVF